MFTVLPDLVTQPLASEEVMSRIGIARAAAMEMLAIFIVALLNQAGMEHTSRG